MDFDGQTYTRMSLTREEFEEKLKKEIEEGIITPDEAESEWDFFVNGSDSYQKYYM